MALTFIIYPGKMFENQFSFTNMTWPRSADSNKD